MQPPVPVWTQRDNFSRIAHQRVVDKINANDRLDLTTAFGRKLWTAVGYVVDEGPDDEGGEPQEDFTDARYWVQLAYCEVADDEETEQIDPIKFTGQEATEGQPHIVCATNLAELPANGFGTGGTHSLSVGRHVRIWAIERRQPDGTLVTVFVFEAAKERVPFRITGDRPRGGNYQVIVYRLVSDGGSDTYFDETATGLDNFGAIFQSTGEEATAINLNERGSDDTHWMTDAANAFETDWWGDVTASKDSEGRRVLTFNGFFGGSCQPAE